ncbi:MAG: hypothetical protein CMJ80_10175 [Planctomycetaceae bacterium]|nr:hypothetical protein [Planctomycetaceae bacterium]
MSDARSDELRVHCDSRQKQRFWRNEAISGDFLSVIPNSTTFEKSLKSASTNSRLDRNKNLTRPITKTFSLMSAGLNEKDADVAEQPVACPAIRDVASGQASKLPQ